MENGKDTGQALLYRFFNESLAAMAVLNGEGLIITGNRKFKVLMASMSRKNSGEGQNSDYFTLFRSSLLPLFTGQHNYAFFEGPINFIENGKDTQRWYNVHAWRIGHESPGSKNSLIGLSLEDNTLVRQEEKRLLQDKEIAQKTMEAKDQFLANMSHEIRTPIQTIIGMTELLQETRLDQEQSEYSRQVKFSATVLLSLINDILDYSKIEAGKMELEQIDFDLEQIIEQAVEMIALEAHKKDLYIATDIPLETNIFIKGDPGKFRQVVINLVKNAVKFTKDGGIIVSAALTELEGKPALRISVSDTGIGISEENRAKLFSSFMQADASNARRFGGTGLGLAISRSLVELMKGRIEMIPNEGGGSIFRFVIPLIPSNKKPAPLPPPERDGKIRILVVDDCPAERRIIVSCLRDLGYVNIDEADAGETALHMMREATIRDNAYQLCFLDMIMPVMDGWRLAAEIHNDTRVKNPDLILMAPHGLMGADTKMTLLKWFKAYVNKPVKRRRLADTIDAVLSEIQELEELEEPEEEKIFEEKPGSETPLPAAGAKKPLILIVEDHLVNQKLFGVILEKLGYGSILAGDGEDAIEKAMKNPVGLVFMDIQMPGITGYEAAQILRSRGFKKPVIAVTASALSDELDLCFKMGMNDILLKPFMKADIEKMLNKWAVPEEALPSPSGNEEEKSAEQAESGGINIFNAAYMLDTFMNEKSLVLTLLERFVDRTQTQLVSIEDYIKAENWEKARLEAHTIKGAALTMGGAELGKTAYTLELAFKNINRDEIEKTYPLLKKAFGSFKVKAEEYIRAEKGE